jgi:hypothetical protein
VLRPQSEEHAYLSFFPEFAVRLTTVSRLGLRLINDGQIGTSGCYGYLAQKASDGPLLRQSSRFINLLRLAEPEIVAQLQQGKIATVSWAAGRLFTIDPTPRFGPCCSCGGAHPDVMRQRP